MSTREFSDRTLWKNIRRTLMTKDYACAQNVHKYGFKNEKKSTNVIEKILMLY